MFIGHLKTDVIEKHQHKTAPEGGQFEMKVFVDLGDIVKSGSPIPFVTREIAIHLAQAIADTGVPRDFWYFEASLEAQKKFNLPARTRLSV